MSPSADEIAKLRLMINEPTNVAPYTDTVLSAYLADNPVMDSAGLESGDDGWVEAYDLHAAAGDVWEQKAAAVQMYYDFSADGGNYSQSQLYEMAMDQARYHFARRKIVGRKSFKKPKESLFERFGLTWDAAYGWWRVN